MEKGRLTSFSVSYLDTDLWIGIDAHSFNDTMQQETMKIILDLRKVLELYISSNPIFLTSLEPIAYDLTAHLFIQHMINTSTVAGTGPMAGVAGAFAEYVANGLIKKFSCKEIIIENGGDIYLKIYSEVIISVFAGNSPLSEKICIIIPESFSPLGVCTSSGTVGPSFSKGKADAVMIACRDTILADNYATAYANRVLSTQDVDPVIQLISKKNDILSAIIIKDEKMGVCGKFKIKLLQ